MKILYAIIVLGSPSSTQNNWLSPFTFYNMHYALHELYTIIYTSFINVVGFRQMFIQFEQLQLSTAGLNLNTKQFCIYVLQITMNPLLATKYLHNYFTQGTYCFYNKQKLAALKLIRFNFFSNCTLVLVSTNPVTKDNWKMHI